MPTAFLFLLLVVAHIIWGGGFIVIKLLIGTFSLPQILLARVFLAAVIYALLWHKIPKPEYRKGDWKFLVLLALCEPFLLFTFETLGLAYTTASQAGMIVACAPLAAALGALFFYKEKVNTRCALGICAAVAGVVVVSAFGEADATASRPLLGNLFIFCGVLSSTAYALTVKHLAERYSFLFLSAVQVFEATLLFLPGALAGPMPAAISWKVLGAMVYLGVGITFFVYVVINYALTRIKAAHVILFANLIPVSTLVLAYLILGERLLPAQYAGAALVICGVLLAGAPESSGTGEEPVGIRETRGEV
ncbi:DMT family transporter [Desulfoluna butyratoxydans]|uniref:Eama domain n=1 Tax=Desulfoluna butyratoxydans TaxID=231438 RepID=A0A4U8YIJ6_9BACT|nr:DMT family transporter [Desulfoluna butyratoxydans]VFQ43180.1 eama domain [Desulfoluna butyratoxydans]